MICPNLMKKVEEQMNQLEVSNAELKKENERLKRIVSAVIKEWDTDGFIDVDILRNII